MYTVYRFLPDEGVYVQAGEDCNFDAFLVACDYACEVSIKAPATDLPVSVVSRSGRTEALILDGIVFLPGKFKRLTDL